MGALFYWCANQTFLKCNKNMIIIDLSFMGTAGS